MGWGSEVRATKPHQKGRPWDVGGLRSTVRLRRWFWSPRIGTRGRWFVPPVVLRR